MNYTKGPWRVNIWDYPNANPPRKDLVIENSTNRIAVLDWDQGLDNPYTIKNDEAQANARLISAAPDMLSFIESMLHQLSTDSDLETITGAAKYKMLEQLAREIIAKAEGKVGLTLREGYSGGILPKVWHGLTVCNQEEADEKIPEFLKVPGKKFLIIEPMLGAVDLWAINDGSWWDSEGATRYNALTGTAWWGSTGEHGLGGGPKIDAVILGGETGPGARPVHPDWVRSVRDQCEASNVPFYFKQCGIWRPV